MSSRVWQLRVQDILSAITSIEQRTAEMTFEQFAADENNRKIRSLRFHYYW